MDEMRNNINFIYPPANRKLLQTIMGIWWSCKGSTRTLKKLMERGDEMTVYTTDGFKSKLNMKNKTTIEEERKR